MKKLNREEQRILEAFERDELKSVITSKVALKRYERYARTRLNMASSLIGRRSAK